jgi:hypothetical protein
MNTRTTASLVLVSAVAALFSVACADNESTATGSNSSAVKCVGINSCKGTSECQSVDGKNSCQGSNECKGEGWVSVPSEAECKNKGGQTFEEAQAAYKADGGAKDSGGTTTKSIKCEGINSCKGTSECASKTNACNGHNDCAGKGWVSVPSEGDCTSKGGKVLA